MARSEKDDALIIAEKVLDRINADPDDDLAVLARQTKRAEELRLVVTGMKAVCETAAKALRSDSFAGLIRGPRGEVASALDAVAVYNGTYDSVEALVKDLLPRWYREQHPLTPEQQGEEAARGTVVPEVEFDEKHILIHKLKKLLHEAETRLFHRDFEVTVHKAKIQSLEQENAHNEAKLIKCTVAMREVSSALLPLAASLYVQNPLTCRALEDMSKKLSDERYAKVPAPLTPSSAEARAAKLLKLYADERGLTVAAIEEELGQDPPPFI